MITDTLIGDEVWAEAPEDPEEAFLFIALEANKKLKKLAIGDIDLGQHDYGDWRHQYIWEICALAGELGVSGLPQAHAAVQSNTSMASFDAALARIITTIKARRRSDFKADAVSLSYRTKDDIRRHLDKLRDCINKSNLSEVAKAGLHKKVDAVEEEVDKKRSSMRAFWILAGALAAATPTAVGALADLPEAMQTAKSMLDVLHSEKADEERRELERSGLLDHAPALQLTHQPDAGEAA